MKVLVTGGAGFIGSHIVEQLVQSGFTTIVVDNLSNGSRRNIKADVVCYETGITDKRLDEVFVRERPDMVVHQAAQVSVQKSVSEPLSDVYTNVIGTLNVLDCCRKFNVKRLVYASSAAVYGNPNSLPVSEDHPLNPTSVYGVSKMTAEFYVSLFQRLFGLQYVILRYANVYGPRQSLDGDGAVIPLFIEKMVRGQSPEIFGDGLQTRDFINVHDVAVANVAALQATVSGTFNISSGSSIAIGELYRMLVEIIGCDVPIRFEKARQGDILHSRLDNRRAQSVLQWNPVHSLERGLRETVAYYQNRAGGTAVPPGAQ